MAAPYFRTNDPLGRWSNNTGGSNITASQYDEQTYDIYSRLTALTNDLASAGADITAINQISANQFTISTSTQTFGPFLLPTANAEFRDAWQANTFYLAGDSFTKLGALWTTVASFTSGATFDPGSADIKKIFDFSKTPVETQSGATFSPTTDDANSYIRLTNPLGCSITIPANATEAFDIGDTMQFAAVASAGVIFEGAPGVTINLPEGKNPVAQRIGATFWVKKVDVDEWDADGRLADSDS